MRKKISYKFLVRVLTSAADVYIMAKFLGFIYLSYLLFREQTQASENPRELIHRSNIKLTNTLSHYTIKSSSLIKYLLYSFSSFSTCLLACLVVAAALYPNRKIIFSSTENKKKYNVEVKQNFSSLSHFF